MKACGEPSQVAEGPAHCRHSTENTFMRTASFSSNRSTFTDVVPFVLHHVLTSGLILFGLGCVLCSLLPSSSFFPYR